MRRLAWPLWLALVLSVLPGVACNKPVPVECACEGGQACVEGRCVPVVVDAGEVQTCFASCPSGTVCQGIGCVAADCASVQCGSAENCDRGACLAKDCAQALCPPGSVCDPASRCVTAGCATVGCPTDEVCVPGGRCAATACFGVTCSLPGQACLGGSCVPAACVGILCPDGSACAGGKCLPTHCSGTPCQAGFVCDQNRCVAPLCVGIVCGAGNTCAGGRCVPVGCDGGTCPEGSYCEGSACVPVLCSGVACKPGTVCVFGKCYPTGCNGVACDPGLACVNNVCLDPLCIGVTCATGNCSRGECPKPTGDGGATDSGQPDAGPGAPVKLYFAQAPLPDGQPTDISAGSRFSPEITVVVLTANNKLAQDSSAPVTLTLNSTNGAKLLGPATSLPANHGIVSFPDLSVEKAGVGYTVTASSPGLQQVVSNPFTVFPGSAYALVFTVQPSAAVAGVPMAEIKVAVRDRFVNLVMSPSASVTLSYVGGDPGATLSGGPLVVSSAQGVASFTGLWFDKAGTSYQLVASAPAIPMVSGDPFDVSSGPASQLVFAQGPTNRVAGAPFSPDLRVELRDALGNVVVGSSVQVTLEIDSASPPGAMLEGTTQVSALAGVATFPGVVLKRAGVGYKLRAKSATLADAVSGSFDVAVGAASQLSFLANPPLSTVAGQTMNPAVQVEVKDSAGNRVQTSSVDVTLSLNNSQGATFFGTLVKTCSLGVATFNDLSIQRKGQGYTLSANAPGVSQQTSGSFAISAASPSQVVFSTQPTDGTAGQALSPFSVQILDSFGNLTLSTAAVSLAIKTGPVGAVLTGSTVAASQGVATFSLSSLNKAGIGYALTATAAGIAPGADSASFDIVPGAAVALRFKTQPTNIVSGSVFSPPVQVEAWDSQGNIASGFAKSVSLSLINASGASLQGTTSSVASNGVATFSGLGVTGVGSSYGLDVVDVPPTVPVEHSNPFDVTFGSDQKLVFAVQPTNRQAGQAFAPDLRVEVRDAAGAGVIVTSFTSNVTLSVNSSTGATLQGGATVRAAVAGVATFSGLNIREAGSGYSLNATAPPATSVVSGTSGIFDVAPAAPNALVFSQQPPAATPSGQTLATVTIDVQDSFGNKVTSGSVAVSLTLQSGNGASLSGTTLKSSTSGTASFSDLSVAKAGSGYTFLAMAAGVPQNGTSSAFSIVAGAPASLAFGQQPTAVAAGSGMSPDVTVRVLDAAGNLTPSSGDLTLSLVGTSVPLYGTLVQPLSGGVAAFSGLSVRVAGSYQIQGAGLGLTSPASNSFAVSATIPAKLTFSQQPGTVDANVAFTPSVAVQILDAYDNLTTSAASLTMALQNPPPDPAATLGGIKVRSASAGAATFSGLFVDKAANGYHLEVSAPGLNGVPNQVSTGFNVNAGAAAALAFAQQPQGIIAGGDFVPTVKVRALDGQGNLANTFSGNVTLSIKGQPAGVNFVPAGNPVAAAVAGVADFNQPLSVDKVGTYQLTAKSADLPAFVGVDSFSFAVSAGAEAKVAFLGQPSSKTAGATILPAVTTQIQDGFGNLVGTSSALVTLSLQNPPAGAVLSGTVTRQSNLGGATFNDLWINVAKVGYQMTARSDPLQAGQSNPFNISAGAASGLVFGGWVQNANPGGVLTMTSDAGDLRVNVADFYGNLVSTGGQRNVTVAIGLNPGGSALDGTKVRASASGVATFTDLSIADAGNLNPYTLTASTVGLDGSTSNNFLVDSCGCGCGGCTVVFDRERGWAFEDDEGGDTPDWAPGTWQQTDVFGLGLGLGAAMVVRRMRRRR